VTVLAALLVMAITGVLLLMMWLDDDDREQHGDNVG
jgi:hypothetical protein